MGMRERVIYKKENAESKTCSGRGGVAGRTGDRRRKIFAEGSITGVERGRSKEKLGSRNGRNNHAEDERPPSR